MKKTARGFAFGSRSSQGSQQQEGERVAQSSTAAGVPVIEKMDVEPDEGCSVFKRLREKSQESFAKKVLRGQSGNGTRAKKDSVVVDCLDEDIISITVEDPKPPSNVEVSDPVLRLSRKSLFRGMPKDKDALQRRMDFYQKYLGAIYAVDRKVLDNPRYAQDRQVMQVLKRQEHNDSKYLQNFLSNIRLRRSDDPIFQDVSDDPVQYFTNPEMFKVVFPTDRDAGLERNQLNSHVVNYIQMSHVLGARVEKMALLYLLSFAKIQYETREGFTISLGCKDEFKQHIDKTDNKEIMARVLRHLRCLRPHMAHELLSFLFYLRDEKVIQVSPEYSLLWMDQVVCCDPDFTPDPAPAPQRAKTRA
jgi:hypothetical protein